MDGVNDVVSTERQTRLSRKVAALKIIIIIILLKSKVVQQRRNITRWLVDYFITTVWCHAVCAIQSNDKRYISIVLDGALVVLFKKSQIIKFVV